MVFFRKCPFSSPFHSMLFSIFPDIYGGYVCFVVSIFAIGVVTAVIGDVASHFGCTLGIKDSVTAIVFVALGTSVPGMYIYICVYIYLYFMLESKRSIRLR